MNEYLKLVRNVLDNGEQREDRTGVGTISLFGTQSRYDLRDGFPLVTTKKVNFGAIKAELFWFLSGSTNVNDLDSKIWSEWSGVDGNLGPTYPHAWRNWGGEYVDKEGCEAFGRQAMIGADGIDQIQITIDTIKTNPTSRRIIISAWNPAELDDIALAPCHLLAQFYVSGNHLDCQMYQRSADLALGVPFNIASYALLMHLIAAECGLEPRYFIHSIGDAHVYRNHIEGLEEQLKRKPKILPTLAFSGMVQPGEFPQGAFDFDACASDDVLLVGYEYHAAIRFKVAV